MEGEEPKTAKVTVSEQGHIQVDIPKRKKGEESKGSEAPWDVTKELDD